MPEVIKTPKHLRPYQFHGVVLAEANEHGIGDCPFCGRESKFAVHVETGQWRCYVCQEGTDKGGGNLFTFLRLLWDRSDKSTDREVDEFARERGLLDPMTLTHWGVCRSFITGEWLVPGHNPDGNLCQLYKRVWTAKDERWELRPTPTLPHQLHGLPLFNPKRRTVYLHESWGNALAFWEVARQAKWSDEGLVLTANEAVSILGSSSILAVANCGAVGEPLVKFLPLLEGKDVVLMFDSDHPKQQGEKEVDGGGFAAVKRAAKIMASHRNKPASIHWLKWGDRGFDPELPSGHDVRDWLKGDLKDRIKALQTLLAKVQPIPEDWIGGRTPATARHGGTEIEPERCADWKTLLAGWSKPIVMRQSLNDALSVMLAVALSTSQRGDGQLFLQVIGEAGSAKTKFCDAMLVSKNCHLLEHLTGFHSGWKDSSGEDFSLIARINHKTLITPEGDVMMSSPNFAQLMSQQRRIFDGSSSASYKNSKEDVRHTGLRTPWIIAGTPAMLNVNQAHLGDRFLKVYIEPPDEDGKREIKRRVGHSAWNEVDQSSNGDASSVMGERMLMAYRLTAGYVDHLRANASELISEVKGDPDEVVNTCGDLADFTAILRARPDLDVRKVEVHDAKELPTRLTHQLVRLAKCLAVVLNRAVDAEIMRRVRKVALDTSRGWAIDVSALLAEAHQEGGMSLDRLHALTGQKKEKEHSMLRFLKRIEAVESHRVKSGGYSAVRWKLTEDFYELWTKIMGGQDA